MPIYEFYCTACNMVFNFLSKTTDNQAIPSCPKCGLPLEKQISIFSRTGRAKEPSDDMMPDFDESMMERAMGELASQAENINEDDPKQMARLMRDFTSRSGLNLGDGMEEALCRMEAGEDPEKVEQEMGDILEGEDPLKALQRKIKSSQRENTPLVDDTLYSL